MTTPATYLRENMLFTGLIVLLSYLQSVTSKTPPTICDDRYIMAKEKEFAILQKLWKSDTWQRLGGVPFKQLTLFLHGMLKVSIPSNFNEPYLDFYNSPQNHHTTTYTTPPPLPSHHAMPRHTAD
ncbi:hypothetical protein M0804_009567 [Polistes exclamans]|nr:hypothetical protein M0804_009567 [Polistes exclamans]